MHELILKFFGQKDDLDDEQKLSMVFAWLEQSEKESVSLNAQYEKLRLKNIELNLIVHNKKSTTIDADDTAIAGDHFSVARKPKNNIDGNDDDSSVEENANQITSSINEINELIIALRWLEDTNKENVSLAADNRQLTQKNLDLLNIIQDKTVPVDSLESEVSNAEHLSIAWSSKNDDIKPVINPKDGSIFVKWRLGGVLQTIPVPKSLVDIKPWIDKYLDERLVLLPGAEKEAKSAVYKNVTLVYQALLLLGNRRDMLVHGGLDQRKDFENRLHELGLRHASSKGQTGSARANAQYEYDWNGAAIVCDQALKRGVSRDPRNTLRIYFTYDNKSRKIVVGHLPTHLSNSLS